MHDAHDCHRKAEALATLAVMFPESAHRYRAKEQHWRDLEAEARRGVAKAGRNLRPGTISANASSSGERSRS
jgi:hypothetical protein